MAALNRIARLDFSADTPDAARDAIRNVLSANHDATRKVYAALAHKVWTLLIERRFDDEVRDWHSLLLGVQTKVSGQDDAVAERMVALSDLLRESISLADTSPARKLAERPHAKRILSLLAKTDGFVPRQTMLAELGLKSAHLSNILTQLSGHSLILRKDAGKEAEFRLTQLGRSLSTANEAGDMVAGFAAKVSALLGSRPGPEITDGSAKLMDSLSVAYPPFTLGGRAHKDQNIDAHPIWYGGSHRACLADEAGRRWSKDTLKVDALHAQWTRTDHKP